MYESTKVRRRKPREGNKEGLSLRKEEIISEPK